MAFPNSFANALVATGAQLDANFNALSANTGSSLVGFTQSSPSAVARTVQDKLQESVSVFDFMTSAQIADVTARTLTQDVTTAIKVALDYLNSKGGGTLEFPLGTYKTTAALTLYSGVSLRGVGGWSGSIINGVFGVAGNLFQYPSIRFVTISGLAFTGSGCTAFKQTSISTSYTESVTWQNCHFYADLAECIYGNLIFARIINNTFGYFGTVGTSHHHITSLGSSTNLTNVNKLFGNRLYNAKGTESVKFDSGTELEIYGNNFESNTATPVVLDGIFNAKILDNWFENNTVATHEIELNSGTYVIDSTPTLIQRNNFVPAASITNIIQNNSTLIKIYCDFNTGSIAGKTLFNSTTYVYSQIGNSLAGVLGFLTQEKGTFTLTDASGAGLALAGGAGNYERNGNTVTFNVSVTYPVTANGNNAKLGGLPYAAVAACILQSVDNSGADVTFATDVAATMTPYTVGTLTARTNAQMSGKLFYISGTYQI